MKIAIYTDDAPISEDKLASGMSRVNSRLFTLMSKNISMIVATNLHGDFEVDDLEPKLESKIKVIKYNGIMLKVINKLAKLRLSIDSLDLGFLFPDSHVVELIEKSKSNALFVPIGSNIRAYKRAISIASKANIPLNVYIVDDFLSSSKLSGDKYGVRLCEKYLTSYLNSTNKIFVISEGMKIHLHEVYNVDSVVLNLPFEKKVKIEVEKSKQILFLGSLSHFYIDGILDLLEQVKKYNDNHGKRIILRLTTNELDERLAKYSDIIDFSKIEGEENLAFEIGKSLFCYVPYSFEEKYKTMVETSFPSKTLEYLSYSKRIVVYGPPYCSAIKYFKEKRLESYIQEKKPELLYDMIRESDEDSVCYTELYNGVLKNYHSYDCVRTKIMRNIFHE